MKQTLGMLVLGLALGLAQSPAARAEAVPELMKALEDQISTMDQAMADPAPAFATTLEKSDVAAAVDANEQWFFQNFFLRIRARWGFEVPGFVKVQIVPEIEMLWQRTPPEGWGAYKP